MEKLQLSSISLGINFRTTILSSIDSTTILYVEDGQEIPSYGITFIGRNSIMPDYLGREIRIASFIDRSKRQQFTLSGVDIIRVSPLDTKSLILVTYFSTNNKLQVIPNYLNPKQVPIDLSRDIGNIKIRPFLVESLKIQAITKGNFHIIQKNSGIKPIKMDGNWSVDKNNPATYAPLLGNNDQENIKMQQELGLLENHFLPTYKEPIVDIGGILTFRPQQWIDLGRTMSQNFNQLINK